MGANCSALIDFCTPPPPQNETLIKYVAFKKAKTTEFIFFDNRVNAEKRTERRFMSNIFKWLRDLYHPETPGNQRWTQWCVYNDVHSHMSSATSQDRRGVANGILTWNGTRIGWMQHTVPNWPSSFGEKGIDTFDLGPSLSGEHSFHYVEFDHDPETDEKLQDIMWQLRQMNFCITLHRMNFSIKHNRVYPIYLGIDFLGKPTIEKLEVIPGLFHIALSSKIVTTSDSYEPDKHYSVLLSDGRSAYWMGHGCSGFLCEDPDMAKLLVEEDCGFQKTAAISNATYLFHGECYQLTMT